MRAIDLARYMGDIDETLLRETEQPIRRRGRRQRWQRALAVAAIVVLMACSCAVGALAFPRETGPETVALDDIGLTLILPEDWRGRWAVEKIGGGAWAIYSPEIREAFGGSPEEPESGGMLCYVWLWRDCWWTADEVAEGDGEWNFAGNRYIMTTEEGTYFLYYASDVQFPPEKEAEYRRMEQGISQLRFLPHLS